MGFRSLLAGVVFLFFAFVLLVEAAATYIGWVMVLLFAAALALGYQGAKVWRGGP